MAFLPLILLALIQGLTEFLPVSSSGHLVLVHAFFNSAQSWDERVILDVAVHIGTLLSVLLYFRRDVGHMFLGLRDWITGDFKTTNGRLNVNLIIASVPVILAGLALHMLKPSWLLSIEIMAWSMIIFGIILWIADRKAVHIDTLERMSIKSAILIGLAQALALIPGTSRSGITMTAARFLGYSRPNAARFSLLLSIIAIGGAGALSTFELIESGDYALGSDVLIAIGLSFLAGWASITLMMRWLEKANFTIFVIYRILLGGILLTGLYSGVFGS